MSVDENKVVVHIFGEDYPFTGVNDPAHIVRVAEYVDSKMNEAARVGRIQARDKVAILAAMSIASELLEKSELDLGATEASLSRTRESITFETISQFLQVLQDKEL